MEKRSLKSFPEEPFIKVCMADGKSLWDFSMPESFSMIDSGGRIILQNHVSDLRWRILLDSYEPAQFIYTLKILSRSESGPKSIIFIALAEKVKYLLP